MSCRPLLCMLVFALAATSTAAHRYRLYLRDKDGSPEATLSDRALSRRAAQGIALDEGDLDLAPAYVAAIREAGLVEVTRSRWLNTIVVERPDGAPVADSLWAALPFVVDVRLLSTSQTYQSAPARRGATRLPRGSAKFGRLDTSTADADETFRTPIREVHGEALLEAGHRGQGMLIAVLDAGFRNVDQHDFLSRQVVGCRDLYHPDSDLFIYASDWADSHGAECLSTMTSDTAHGVWGTAPEASFFLIRTEYVDHETAIEEDMWVAGAELADSLGADLISSSLGYYDFDDDLGSYTHADLAQGVAFVSRGAAAAAARGILVVTAAGNDAMNAWGVLDFPADARDVLAVGGTTSNRSVAYFSSPGFLSPWVKPDVACRGQGAYIINTSTGTATRGSGTSYATPMLCGLVASLWSAVPDLTAEQIRQLVRQSGSQASSPDVFLGYGLPDFATALHDAHLLSALPRVVSLPAGRPALFDLQGRRLAAPPARGLYVEGGQIRSAVGTR